MKFTTCLIVAASAATLVAAAPVPIGAKRTAEPQFSDSSSIANGPVQVREAEAIVPANGNGPICKETSPGHYICI
ncbi:Hypothetical predicted protein [Lecanosticta acicola]|uniref:Uncharacterized protein n=1 Tax=Lecanosticta acicola TaxID=111012 RepID=A0AAI8Z5V4_9PEZI|nr:Hypothetical predicted protein [Lecanosticta acicola]